MASTLSEAISILKSNSTEIDAWLHKKEHEELLPFYTSVDIRDSGFKIAGVDTNLFPAGFNNLCLAQENTVIEALKETIHKRVPNGNKILFITEENTRNTFYLENVYVLKTIMEKSGFEVTIASFLNKNNEYCENNTFIELKTHSGKFLKMNCLNNILGKIESDLHLFDLIILNNDLTTGIPDILKNTDLPIYPSLQAGWHSRLKSHHFCEANRIIKEFSEHFNIDPWLFSCLFKKSDLVNINEETDRQKLFELAKELFQEIEEKYKKFNINKKPFIFLKSDKGTYGMGVHAIESPEEILHLNRKQRNKLNVGKGSQLIERFILQEGVPSVSKVDYQVGEACVYQIANTFVGGFYRINSLKSERENLNSKGMSFKKMCASTAQNPECSTTPKTEADKAFESCGMNADENIFIYKIIARLSGIAAHREILTLESKK